MGLIRWLILGVLAATPTLFALPTYTGYSSAPGRGTCAATCHGAAGGTVQIAGFPTEYVPDSLYEITISRLSGLAIKNFNGSCRVGTGSVNAGLISSGARTSTYNVPGETNGIHLSQLDQVSAVFNWRAPAAGTGEVRLYIGAHQGVRTGPNTRIMSIASERIDLQPPDPCTNPNPANNAGDVLLSGIVLSWQNGARAEVHDIYLGTQEPLNLLQADWANSAYLVQLDLSPGTVYRWRINSRNAAGTTTGSTWTFETGFMPDTPSTPNPPNGSFSVEHDVILSWAPANGATTYNICFGTENPPPPAQSGLTVTQWDPPGLLNPETVYFWEIATVNNIGTTPGPIWTFTTDVLAADDREIFLPTELTLGPVFPNPFNAEATIPFALPSASNVRVELFDILGRDVATIENNFYPAGTHTIRWNSSTVGTGVYLLKLTTASDQRVVKVISLK